MKERFVIKAGTRPIKQVGNYLFALTWMLSRPAVCHPLLSSDPLNDLQVLGGVAVQFYPLRSYASYLYALSLIHI